MTAILANEFIPRIVNEQKKGRAVGIYSICSANRFVLEASMLQAKADGAVLCIESSSNQVNQFGGYVGQTPREFVRFVESIAGSIDFPTERIILGGDHLGPHVWQNEVSASAMSKACELVHQSVLAGYTKIHLDTSMACADDPRDPTGALSDETITLRTADLCRVGEMASSERPDGSARPYYVIGTEVPIPGGEQPAGSHLAITRTEDLDRTVELAKSAFLARGLEEAWQRVVAVVVQPGVEFGGASIFPYNRENARPLSLQIEKHNGLVFEAHSTDYQTREALKSMVEDHFAILKVGPCLTYAFREAVFALAETEEEWLGRRKGVALSQIRETLERAMITNPVHWRNYYQGDEADLAYARKYSYSDRCRYYWPQSDVDAALGKLLANLKASPPPLPLLSQYLPVQYETIRQGRLSNNPEGLIHHKIIQVIACYAEACGCKGQPLL
jgi:D-tagatose-1,6-bisphosphate aldolase subunit GatZ/KbaZ